MPSPAPLDQGTIARAMQAHGVECIIVGGVAATIHGATRPTEDLDLVTRFDQSNLERLADAMRELGAYPRLEGYLDAETIAVMKRSVDAALIARTEITTWNSDAGPFDILRSIPGADGRMIDYQQLERRALDLDDPQLVTVRVAALVDVVASKQWTNRRKDREALPELRRLLGATQPPPTARPAYPTPVERDPGQDLER